MTKNNSVEILSPCGDFEALKGAICAGADAVYFGLDLFNARIRAKNFNFDNLADAVNLCHAHGVKVYVTLNIAVYDKEIPKMIEYVSILWENGVDALIVSDLGCAKIIREHFPLFEIHASTQCTAHNLDGVEFLYENGFSRVVTARELDKQNIEYICKNSPCEIEIFVHGAHCMSVSGQCLMSYSMGGRSGNRGECAQPCRLPYKIGNKNGYFLSLKDMSLSDHIKEIVSLGVKSLKIEGRMKNCDYVYNVTKTYKRLTSENRNITESEKRTLGEVFSRQGFTDGFYMSQVNSQMLGVRSDENKAQTKEMSQGKTYEVPKVKINLNAKFISGENAELTLYNGEKSVTCYGKTVEEAQNCPTSKEDIIKNLSKFGQTPFCVDKIDIEKSENVMVPLSQINALRRSAVSEFLKADRQKTLPVVDKTDKIIEKTLANPTKKIKTAVFSKYEQIPKNYNYFDIRFVYADRYKKDERINGIYLPPVIFDTEWAKIDEKMKEARENGIEYALVSNIGQIKRVKAYGFKMIADFRFNVFNKANYCFLKEVGFENIILSPEVSLRQGEDMLPCSVIAYGKFPVMTTQKCIIKDTAGCEKCACYLTDRTGAVSYVEGIFGHRNIIYNSVPVYMADKYGEISRFSHHFIFTNESATECENIIDAYKNKLLTDRKIRRIK